MMGNCHDKKLFNKLLDMINEITLKLYMLPKIVIASVQGSAVGLGLSIALNSDFIVAHKEVKLGVLFAGIGLIPDGGGHFFLQERLGTHQAKQFIWSLEKLKAKQAKKIGLVDVVTEAKAEEAVQEVVQKVMMAPFQALIRSKMLLHETKQVELAAFLEAEKAGQIDMSQTNDHQEGITAFLEKRFPVFTGN